MNSREWIDVSLGDVVTLEYGAALPADVRGGDAVPVFGSNGEVGRHRVALAEGPGIIVGRKGSVGALTWSENDFWPIDTTYYVKNRPGTDLRWIYWVLGTLGLERLDSSTGVPGLNRKDAYERRLLLPSYTAQRKIVEILDRLDGAIRIAESIVAKRERLGEGLLDDLLNRGVDCDGRLRDGEAASHSSAGRGISTGWSVVALSDIASVDRGRFSHRPRNDPRFLGGDHSFIQTGDIAALRGRVITRASQSLSDLGAAVSREFPTGTIAVTIAANIADTAVLGRPMFFPDSVVGVVVAAPNNTGYVEMVIRNAKRRLEARAPQSAQRNINLQDLRPLVVPLPEPEEQDRIVECYAKHADALDAEKSALSKLVALKVALASDLLNGHTRLPSRSVS